MEFEWDEGNIEKSLVKHNVHDWEIEEALLDEEALIVARSVVDSERRRVLLGGTSTSGRYLRVVFTVRIRDGVSYYRPISAVEMADHEKRRYQRRRR